MHKNSNNNGRISRQALVTTTVKPTTTPSSGSALPTPSISSTPVSCTAPSAAATIIDSDIDDQVKTTTASGRTVAALPLHTPTTYQTLVSTLSALGPIASGSSRTVGSWGRSAFGTILAGSGRRVVSEGGQSHSSASSSSSLLPGGVNTAGHVPSPSPQPDVDDHNGGGMQHHHLPGIDEQDEDNDEQTAINEDALSASIHHRPSAHDDPILFSNWDTLPLTQTRVLIQVFHSGRIKVWDAANFGELMEVLNIEFGKVVGDASVYPLMVRFIPASLGTSAPLEQRHVPLLAILASDSAIHLYSTSSHRVLKRLSVNGAGQFVNFQINDRFLVAATIQPLSLYIWNLATLELCPFSPITDLAPHPYDHTPVYDLSSHRLLAYSSTTSPNYGGSGIIATSGWNENGTSDITASNGGGRATSSQGGTVGINGGGGNNNGADYGETARRWGEGMMSHMKAVTDYGYSRYYGGGGSNSPHSGLTPPSSQHSPAHHHHPQRIIGSSRPTSSSSHAAHTSANNFTKSAPHPSSPFYSRSPEVGGHLSASPASGMGRVPSYSPRASTGGTASSSASSSVVVIDLVASMKSFTVSSRPGSSAQRSRSPQVTRSSTPSGRDNNGLVPIAHFKPSKNHPLTLLSINPTGTLILTSSSEGHSFHVFELRPPSYAGNSSIRTTSPSRQSPRDTNAGTAYTNSRNKHLQASNPDLKVWHRYRLNRGLTVAKTVSAQWSPDSRFVLVSTSRGTVHVYPINPLGGKATPETHLSNTVRNEKMLARLSVTVNALARVKAPKLPASTAASLANGAGKDDKIGESKEKEAVNNTSPPDMMFVSLDSLPVHGPNTSRQVNRSAPVTRTIPLLLFYPHLHSILQSNLHLSSSPKTAPSDAPLSTRVTSQAVSGLTQMMRNRGSALPTFESETLLARQEWISQWPLALEDGLMHEEEEEIRVDLSKVDVGKESLDKGNRMRITSAHEAELESFNHAPAVLPRSIYLAQVLTFHTYPPSIASKQGNLIQQFSSGNFVIPKTTKVVVREEVSHRFGSYAGQPFDESTELHSAMHTILDATNLSNSYGTQDPGGIARGGQGTGSFSPSSNSPAFPNGYGKTSSSSKWLPSPGSLASLPIPIGISPQTVRQAATKVRKYSASMRSPRLNAVGSSGGNTVGGAGGASAGHSLQGSTLSFEDDDAVLAQIPPEMMEIDEEGVDLGARRPYRSAGRPASSSLRPSDNYGSPSPAPLPSLSAGTASSAESQAGKSADSPEDDTHRTRMRTMEDPSPPMHAASITDEEGRNEGEWDSFKLEGIDDEEDLKASATLPFKQKLPSPLLSHAMLPILAAKSEQAGAAALRSTTRDAPSTSSPKSEDQKSVLTVPTAFNSTASVTPAIGTALDMAYKPLEPEAAPVLKGTIIEAPLISPTLSITAPYQETASPSPLSSSPAVSSAAEFSASPATAAVLAMKRNSNNKKKNKKGKN